ncbi:hypothetical protein SB758_37460, partial [Burkholderia sp. SIMBA_013]
MPFELQIFSSIPAKAENSRKRFWLDATNHDKQHVNYRKNGLYLVTKLKRPPGKPDGLLQSIIFGKR